VQSKPFLRPRLQSQPFQNAKRVKYKEWNAENVMGELVGSVSEPPGCTFNHSTVKQEIIDKQRLWIALMMGLHRRVGLASMIQNCPDHLWTLICVDALGTIFTLKIENGAWHEQHVVYSALEHASFSDVVLPLSNRVRLELRRFACSLDDGVRLAHRKSLHELNVRNGSVVTMKRPPAVSIAIHVKGQDGLMLHFKMGVMTKLGKFMERYCSHKGLQYEQIRFLFNGDRLQEDETPISWPMDDEAVVDAMLFQVGD